MQDALRKLEEEGFRAQFASVAGGEIRCLSCRDVMPATEVTLLRQIRIDTTTDPGDQSVVAGLECTHCGAKGTAVFSYGPAAAPEDAETYRQLTDHRQAPGVSSP